MFHWLRVVGFLLWSFSFLAAQDIDSVPSVQRRNLASIADEIADPAERSAFLQLFKPATPAEMRTRAEAFNATFPQSAFLAQAYDVEARQNLNSAAIAHAKEALDDLDRFAGPSSVRDEDWPNVKQQLKSTANFAKGRALLQAALTQPVGETRRELLKNSEASLLEALHFNNRDLEIAYVLGLAQLSFGKATEASNSFAGVYRGGSELAPKALDNLRTIYHLLYPSATISFENFSQQATDRWTTVLQNSNI